MLGFGGSRHERRVTAVDGAVTDPRGFVGDDHGVNSTGPCSFVFPNGARGVRSDCGLAGGCGIAVAFAARNEVLPGALTWWPIVS